MLSKNLDHELSDEALLMLYQNETSPEIIGVFFERYSTMVLGVCLKYLKNKESAKDATQEIFKKLIEDLKKYDIGNFKSWLYTLSKNHCLMQLRKHDQKSVINNNESFLANFMESDDNWHPTNEDIKDESLSHLNECLQNLSEEQKSCIEKFYYKKSSYIEITKELNLDLKKVKSLLQNGRRNLKLCMEKKIKNIV